MFKEINGFENYSISDDGLVMNSKGEFLKPTTDNYGYKQLTLCKYGVKVNKRINRLVAEAFIPNPNNYPEVDHINQKRDDDRIENLRWISSSGNGRNTTCKSKYLKGVRQHGNRFQAQIRINKIKTHLGMFSTEEAAHQAYLTKYNEIMKQFEKE